MRTHCFILHDSKTEAAAQSLYEQLHRHEVDLKYGPVPEGCNVLISLITLDDDQLQTALKDGTIVIPFFEGTRSKSSPDTWIQTAVSHLSFLFAVPDPNSDAEDTQLFDAAVAALKKAQENVQQADILTKLETILHTTQELTEALRQAGQVQTERALYAHSNVMLHAAISETEVEHYAMDVLDSIAEIISDATSQVASNEYDDEDAAELYSDCHQHLLFGLETSYGLQIIDALIDDIISSGRPATASLIFDVVNLAFVHGDDLFERDAFQWALQVYLLATKGILRVVGDQMGVRDGTADVVRQRLGVFADLEVDGPIANADEISGELRSALKDVLASADGERSWEHDS